VDSYFQELGQIVNDLWFSVGYDDDQFPRVAARALVEFPPRDVTADTILTPLLTRNDCIRQFDAEVQPKFGDLALTVFRCSRFHIDALFWVDGTTSIHQHGFDGAFRVIAGSSIHSQFRFVPQTSFSNRLIAGDLNCIKVELLSQGDTREIHAGERFVHSLFHLDRPSITLVVRTTYAPNRPIQFGYERSGLAYDPFFLDALTLKRIQWLGFVASVSNSDYERIAAQLVRRADPLAVLSICRAIYSHMRSPERFDRFLETVRSHQPELFDRIRDAFHRRFRDDCIIAGRRGVPESHLRFLLAVLLNVEGLEPSLALVKARVPDRPAVDTVVSYVEELAQKDWAVDGLTNSQGIALVGVALDVLRAMLQGVPSSELVRSLESHYRVDDVQANANAVEILARDIRNSVLFHTLFDDRDGQHGVVGSTLNVTRHR